jgi:hypothetical protein
MPFEFHEVLLGLGTVEKAKGGSWCAKATFDAEVIAHPIGGRISGTIQEIDMSADGFPGKNGTSLTLPREVNR